MDFNHLSRRQSRRASDHFAWASFLVGALTIGAAVLLKILSDASDTLIIALAALGGILVPGSHVLDAIRLWTGRKPSVTKHRHISARAKEP